MTAGRVDTPALLRKLHGVTVADLPDRHPLRMRRPRIVTVLAKKGGTGKTTITQGLASAARARGLRTWVADFDPQCNLTNLVRGKSYTDKLAAYRRGELLDRPRALYDVLTQEYPRPAHVLASLYTANDLWSGLYLLPATMQLDLVDRMDSTSENASVFHRALAGLAEHMDADELPDIIVCDTRPAFNLLTIQALGAADTALVAVEPERFPLEGLKDAWGTLNKLREAGALPNLHEAAVVLAQVDRREAEHRARLPEIRKAFSSVLWEPELPDRTVVAQALSAGYPLHDYPDDRADEPRRVFDKWLKRIMDGKVEA